MERYPPDMTTLAIVRHAKSDWGDASISDHDRPLNARGSRDAPRMAALVADREWRPSVILSSTAVRALTTARAFGEALGVRVEERPELYGASAQNLLDAAVSSGATDVMVVAHDPGMSILGRHLSDDVPLMPTCAVAVFRWDAPEWDAALTSAPDEVTYDIPRDTD